MINMRAKCSNEIIIIIIPLTHLTRQNLIKSLGLVLPNRVIRIIIIIIVNNSEWVITEATSVAVVLSERRKRAKNKGFTQTHIRA